MKNYGSEEFIKDFTQPGQTVQPTRLLLNSIRNPALAELIYTVCAEGLEIQEKQHKHTLACADNVSFKTEPSVDCVKTNNIILTLLLLLLLCDITCITSIGWLCLFYHVPGFQPDAQLVSV